MILEKTNIIEIDDLTTEYDRLHTSYYKHLCDTVEKFNYQRGTQIVGGKSKLSLALGRNKNCVSKALERKSFAELKKLSEDITKHGF